MALYKNSFGADGKSFVKHGHKQNNTFTDKHANKLKKTSVLNQDFRSVVKRYKEDPHALIYLDAPYVKGGDTYKVHGVTPKEVCDSVKNSKAIIVMSYDKNAEVKNACKNKGLKLHTISFKYADSKNGGISNKLKQEYLITNY